MNIVEETLTSVKAIDRSRLVIKALIDVINSIDDLKQLATKMEQANRRNQKEPPLDSTTPLGILLTKLPSALDTQTKRVYNFIDGEMLIRKLKLRQKNLQLIKELL